MMKYATCHTTEKAYGKGLCKPCYIKEYYKINKERLSSNAKKRYLSDGKRAWKQYYNKNRERIVARQRDYRERNKAEINRKQKLNWSRYKYGVSQEFIDNLIKDQNNKCLGCQGVFTDTLYPCVDHCHKSNKIRGLLCDPCNKSLGILKDSSTTLRRLAEYIDQNQKD